MKEKDKSQEVRKFYTKTPFPNDQADESKRVTPTTLENLDIHRWILNSIPLEETWATCGTYHPTDHNTDRPKTILDIGCGTGEMTFFLSEQPIYWFKGKEDVGRTLGVDFSEASIKKANEMMSQFPEWLRRRCQFRVDDITKTKLKGKFDWIFCIGVFHHIPDQDAAIRNIKKLMDKDSLFIINVYNK